MRVGDIRELAFINMADDLTDEELRRQLIAYGAKTVGPITATTRPIYIKKLNHLKVAAKKPGAPAVKSKKGHKVLNFSSDESEDEAVVEPANRPRSVGRSGRGRQNESTVTTTTRTTRTTAKTTLDDSLSSSSISGRRPLRSTSHYNDSDSRSFSMPAPTFISPGVGDTSRRLNKDRSSTRLSPRTYPSTSSTSLRYSDDLDLSDSDAEYDAADGRDSPDDSYRSYTSNYSPDKVSVSVNTSPRLDDSSLFNRTLNKLGVSSIWGRRQSFGPSNESFNKPTYERPARPKSPVNLAHDDDYSINHRSDHNSLGRKSFGGEGGGGSSLFGSNRTYNTRSVPLENKLASNMNSSMRRRSQTRMSNNSPPNHITQNDDKLGEEENILQQGFKTKEDPSSYKISQNISMVLLFLAVLFFVSLAGVYIGMNSPRAEVVEIPSRDNWMICSPSDPTEGCYPRENVENARLIILDLADMLSERAGMYDCGTSSVRNMTRQEAQIRLSHNFRDRGFGEGAAYDFSTALNLIIGNPHWKIRLHDRLGSEARRAGAVHSLESLVPVRGLVCRLRLIAVNVVYYVAGLFSIGMAIFLVVSFMRYRWRKQEEETRQVYQLVEQVIDMLMTHHERCQNNRDIQPYLAIPHVRDMIIDPKQRRSMQHLWDSAVKFLSANESRIRVETQKIAGEEFAVWRWLPLTVGSSSLQTNTNGKVWQGPAFGEKSESNYSHYTPTPCLKIRNMFDPTMECEKDWHINIQDAILEKVIHANGSHGIEHIAVDKNSEEGCVYIKCCSPEEAGKAYKALHGWWFDNSLVTVKYLRLNRYYERFPEAERYNSPLSPSNNQRRSLAQPFHSSIIESC